MSAAAPLTLDLIVCTYDNAALLERTLAAIAAQEAPDDVAWRVTVVDNNCTDDTPGVVARHAAAFPVPLERIAEGRQGLHHARARGVRHTDGDWIAFVDDDCLLAPDWVAAAARFARERPDCGGFGGAVVLDFFEAPAPAYARNRPWAYAGKGHGDQPHRRATLAGIGMVLRRDALLETGWLENPLLEDRTGSVLVSGGDVEMSLRVGARHPLWHNPACRVRHLIPARRLTRPYVRRIARGLGASRHHALALQWRGTAARWRLYSALYGVGMGLAALGEAAREVARDGRGADIPAAFAPARGWVAAMGDLARMAPERRRALLGAVSASPAPGS